MVAINGRRQATATSSFGVGRRENHDSSAFYQRFSPPVLSDDQDVRPPAALDQIYVGDSRSMDQVASASVALVVTSPPYFAGKQYEQEIDREGVPSSYAEYLQLLEEVFAECVRTLEPGGRVAVNVANLGRKPYRSLSSDVLAILQDRLGLLLRGEVIWRKARGAGGSCAWGSFCSPSNPSLRDLTERVVVASKGRFDRALAPDARSARGLPHRPSVTADEFMEATLDVWELAPESATRVGHPAPFPVELPQRLMELHTWEGDLVLDPFMGAGATAVAARRTGRHYVGYDTDEGYVLRARERAADACDGPGPGLLPTEPTRPVGSKAAGTAADLLRRAGFRVDTTPRPRQGVTPTLLAYDAADREWLVDVAGGFTTARPGLRRTEVLERALGRAARLSGFGARRLLLLATDVPSGRSAQGRTLRDARGRILVDVVPVDGNTEAATRRLHAYATGGSVEPVGDLLPSA